MAGMADQQDVPAAGEMLFRLPVDLADQRAGGVEVEEVAARRLGRDGFRYAMRREDHGGVVRHLVQLLDEDGALAFQVFDDEAVVDYLVPDINRRAVAANRL